MPTINKGSMSRADEYHRTGADAYIHHLYNTQHWKKLRDSQLMYNPLCQRCLANGKTTSATEVHHVRPISTGRNALEMKQLAFDSTNLMSLCSECHHELHQEMKGK